VKKSKNSNREISIDDILKYDLTAGIVVYLVALPLCLGIAYASGAPLISGVIAGIVGGMIISMLSGSQINVSGPAAGLTVIVWDAIDKLGSFEAFLLAVFMAGVFQLILGFCKAGVIANYFPTPVIKGMLAAIGVILILKQIPHAIGYDIDYIGDFNFLQWDHENTFTELWNALRKITPGATIISLVSVFIMIFWNKIIPEKLKFIPGPLIVVLLAVLLNYIYHSYFNILYLDTEHLVQIPTGGVDDLVKGLSSPDFSQLGNINVYKSALTLALVASVETLLSINAVDKLDPLKRKTPPNRELKAQGLGNMISSLIGGLVITAVIVRGAANATAGARTRFSSFFHGIFLLVSLLIFPAFINHIPLACLASILLVVGYKLTNISLYKSLYNQGWEQFVPFLITIFAIVFTDLLTGIGIGMAVAALFILRRNLLNPYSFHKEEDNGRTKIKIILSQEVSFLNKANIAENLNRIPKNAEVIIDGTTSRYIDDDIMELIEEFKNSAHEKNINLELIGLKKAYEVFKHKRREGHIQQDYKQLFINNKKWVEDKLKLDPEYFQKLAEGQYPRYLFIGCSDSRVPANEITGTDAGEMFVHRNIANLVIHTDMNLMSVLQYSVEVLKVEHVIVCGHYGCGGVKAAVDSHDQGLIEKWLTNIKDVYRLYYNELEAIKDDEERHKRLVELNVREQVYHLCMTGIVQQAWANGDRPQVHGWVYDINEGFLKDLEIDVHKDFKNFKLYAYETKEVKVINETYTRAHKFFEE
jgi:carbonic anhydrase